MMRRAVLPIVLAAACLAGPACGFGHTPDFTIGFRRVSLDLSYKDQAFAKPAAPDQIVIPQPVAATAPLVTFQPPRRPQGLPVDLSEKAPDLCPKATADEHPDAPVTVFATTPPKEGVYLQHNSGDFSLGLGTITSKFQMPKHSLIEIRNVHRDHIDDSVNGPTDVITWDVIEPGISGQTTRTYRTTFSPSPVVSTVQQALSLAHAPAGELDLMRLHIISGKTEIDFQPQPPVTLMAFKNGQGTSWNSAGIDQRDGTSMVVQGSITKRANVDLCGKVYDTYEVESNEHIASLRSGLQSDTGVNQPNVYDVATQYGGLFVHQHISSTTQFPTDNGTSVTIVANYDQTFDSISPAP